MTAERPTTPGARPPQATAWPPRRLPQRRLLPQVVELAAIIAFLLVTYHGILWYWEYTAPKEVTIAEVVGMNEHEALRVLSSAGLRPEVTTRKASEDAPSGEVISSEPPPGRQVKAGRRVRLTVSSGSRWAFVPDVREMSVDRARALLTQENLEIGKQLARFHRSIPVGYVIAQNPPADKKVARGTSVDLVVSKGPTPEAEPVEEDEKPAVRTTQVEYDVPPGASLQEIRIVVDDRRGERTVYRDFRRPGEKVSESVTGEGPNAVVRLYVSGVLAQEKPF
ncbi:MAG: PASTA domain-containing protein [Armatimonadota bacterium]